MQRETISVNASSDAESMEARRARWVKSRNFVPSRHLWIGCLFNTTKLKLHEAFARFGKIEDISFLRDRRCAFVDFFDKQDAITAFKAMQNQRIGDQLIELGFGKERIDPLYASQRTAAFGVDAAGAAGSSGVMGAGAGAGAGAVVGAGADGPTTGAAVAADGVVPSDAGHAAASPPPAQGQVERPGAPSTAVAAGAPGTPLTSPAMTQEALRMAQIAGMFPPSAASTTAKPWNMDPDQVQAQFEASVLSAASGAAPLAAPPADVVDADTAGGGGDAAPVPSLSAYPRTPVKPSTITMPGPLSPVLEPASGRTAGTAAALLTSPPQGAPPYSNGGAGSLAVAPSPAEARKCVLGAAAVALDRPFYVLVVCSFCCFRLIRWIEMVIRNHGGRVSGASLGSALSTSNAALYKSVKMRYGGLFPLLSGHLSHNFNLENNPPFNHVSLRDAPLGRAAAAWPDTEHVPVAELEDKLVAATEEVLRQLPAREPDIKAVELANVVRGRIGTAAMARVRTELGGLLVVLERHPEQFMVNRIPKNDAVRLRTPAPSKVSSPAGAWGSGATLSYASAALAPGGRAGVGDGVGAGAGTGAAVALGVSPVVVPAPASGDAVGDSALPPTDLPLGANKVAASRCLHISAVSPDHTEGMLQALFQPFGELQTVRLVAQKGRRFAFVTFERLDDAAAAKDSVCKAGTFPGNVSYAKRETISIHKVCAMLCRALCVVFWCHCFITLLLYVCRRLWLAAATATPVRCPRT